MTLLLAGMMLMAPPSLASDDGVGVESPLGEVVADAALEENRGGQAVQISTNNLNATLYENQAVANITGANFVGGGAFAGATGFPTIVQNSGNNVIIQNATVVNLDVH
jgi:hypothetical protein